MTMTRTTRDDWRRSLVERHTACLDAKCKWPEVDCSGGTDMKRPTHEHDREAIGKMRRNTLYFD